MDLWIGIGIGVLGGMLLTIGLMVAVMRSKMVIEHKSPHDVPTTLGILEGAVQNAGWTTPGQWNLAAAAAKKGIEFGREVTNLSLCKAPYAKRVLDQKPEMAVMMPCTFSVYTKADGNTYVAKMNTGLMGKMMGGEIAKVMGGHVAAEEALMLRALAGTHTA